MEREGQEIHISTTEVRGGTTPHIVRYVLGFSLLLAVLALSAIWIIGATTSDRDDRTGASTTAASASPNPTQS